MSRLLVLFVCTILFASQIDIDVKALQKAIQKNPNDTDARIILAKYYFAHNNFDKAAHYLEPISNNKIAKKYLQAIAQKKLFFTLLQQHRTLSRLIRSVDNITAAKIFPFVPLDKLDDTSKLLLAKKLFEAKKFSQSQQILQSIPTQSLTNIHLQAYNNFYLHNYKKAKKLFWQLFRQTKKMEYGYKLLDIALAQNDIYTLHKLLKQLEPYSSSLTHYQEKLQKLLKQKLQQAKKTYQNRQNFSNLQSYFWLLYDFGKKKQALDILQDFTLKHPKNFKAKLLLAKTLAWEGNYSEAKTLIHEISTFEPNNLEAQKLLAHIYIWTNQKAKAKALLQKLVRFLPKDKELAQSLALLTNDKKALIQKYQRLVQLHPNNKEYVTTLAHLYLKDKKTTQALRLLQNYFANHTNDISIIKEMSTIYLQQKNFYKGFGGLEFWAQMKGTPQAMYRLALAYSQYGFLREALSVLDELLLRHPNYQKALLLKAKILRLNPRYLFQDTDSITSRAKKLLYYANKAYFNSLYNSAASYYKEYLSLEPDDSEARERYAYALEYAKRFGEAAGEFFILLETKKTPLIQYHYAFNLQKIGKLKKAKKIYEQILAQSGNYLPQFIEDFLQRWKEAWESLDIERYAAFYNPHYFGKRWKRKKAALFKKSGFIKVTIIEPHISYHKENIYKVQFFQKYLSKTKEDEGYKTLTLQCRKKKCSIIKEEWKKARYKPIPKPPALVFYIKNNLKLIDTQLNNQELNVEQLIQNYKKKIDPSSHRALGK